MTEWLSNTTQWPPGHYSIALCQVQRDSPSPVRHKQINRAIYWHYYKDCVLFIKDDFISFFYVWSLMYGCKDMCSEWTLDLYLIRYMMYTLLYMYMYVWILWMLFMNCCRWLINKHAMKHEMWTFNSNSFRWCKDSNEIKLFRPFSGTGIQKQKTGWLLTKGFVKFILN